MAQGKSAFVARLPGIAVGIALATFAFYFIFLRHGPAATAEASQPKPPVVAPPPAAPVEPDVAVTTRVEPEPARPAPVVEPPRQDPPAPALPETPFEARNAIGQVFAGDLDDARRAALAQKAIALNQQLIVATSDTRDVEIAEILQGENPTSFSRRFKQLHGEYGIVQLVNGIRNVTTVRAGTRLRVPRGTWSIVVDKSLFTLYLCYQGAPYKAYRVCIGTEDKTVAARYLVGTKNPKPDWTAPPDWLEREKIKGPIIRYGDPKNPLGEYWLALDCQNGNAQGLGIHGTNAPESIGTKASMGCVRMLNPDVLEIARIAWKGMEVAIVE
jgi:lipoprotein-anchoring transpeptidase ErfK/SrfK